MLKKGSSGDAVRHVQVLLASLGYSLGKGGADGIFGNDTEAAVMQFQLDQRLDVDGIVGPKTLAVLEAVATAPKGSTNFVAQSSGASMSPTLIEALQSGALRTQGTLVKTQPTFEVLSNGGTMQVLGARLPWPVVAVGGVGLAGLVAWLLFRKKR
jgi:peptidoglycan hydrolase-like protein with peptidoglycan-binding domain